MAFHGHSVSCSWVSGCGISGLGIWGFRRLLGGSWVVISGVISPLIWVTSIVTLLITPLIPTHEPPSRVLKFGRVGLWGLGFRDLPL